MSLIPRREFKLAYNGNTGRNFCYYATGTLKSSLYNFTILKIINLSVVIGTLNDAFNEINDISNDTANMIIK